MKNAATATQTATGEWVLRADLLGAQDPLTVKILVLFGERSDPTFAVRQCSGCKDVLGLKDGHGVTHGMCNPCIWKIYPEVAEKVIAQQEAV